jgi:hypothetical protein
MKTGEITESMANSALAACRHRIFMASSRHLYDFFRLFQVRSSGGQCKTHDEIEAVVYSFKLDDVTAALESPRKGEAGNPHV